MSHGPISYTCRPKRTHRLGIPERRQTTWSSLSLLKLSVTVTIPLHWEATVPKAKRQEIYSVRAAGRFLHQTLITPLISFEQIELPAKLLDYFLWSNKSNTADDQLSKVVNFGPLDMTCQSNADYWKKQFLLTECWDYHPWLSGGGSNRIKKVPDIERLPWRVSTNEHW